MEITLDELLKGKATRIKGKDYFPTAGYVEPFLDRISSLTNDLRIQVQTPNQITLNPNGDIDFEDITYNRVWIQAVLPDSYSIINHKNVIGMIYGLDVRKPVVKFYKGALNMACTNLCVFDPEELDCAAIEPESAINFKNLSRLIEQTDKAAAWLNSLSSTEFKTDEYNINEALGRWIRNCITSFYDTGFGKAKIACSTPVDAYKDMFEKEDSPYYIGMNNPTTMFTVYNAFTQQLTDNLKKDLMNQAEKTLLLKQVLDLE
jgi:hypothetical protein